MRLLWVSPYVPSTDAPHAGAVTIHQLLRRLSAGNEITLVTLQRPGERLPDELRDLCAAIHAVPYASWNAARGIHRWRLVVDRVVCWARSRLNGNPYFVEKYRVARLAALLRKLCAAERFDLVQIEYNMMALYRPFVMGGATVLDLHEVGTLPLRRFAERHGGLRGWPYRDELRRWTRFERKAYRGFDRVIAVTDADRALLATYARVDNVVTIPHGVAADEFAPEPASEEPGSVVFVGSFGHVVNVDAIVWFVRSILPRVWNRRPDVRLWIVGSNPPPGVRALASDNRVLVTGFVDRVQRYLAKAEVVVAPLRIGGGIKIKVLQALSMEKAVVMTPVGGEGIAGQDGVHYRVAESEEDFAGAVLDLLQDADARRRMGQEGRRLVLERYDWSVIAGALRDLAEELTQRTAPMASPGRPSPFGQ